MVRALLALVLLVALPGSAYEGKWTPQQVLELGDARLKAMGLQLPARRLWDPARGTGLLAGAVWVSGCSAGFVSADGLLVTNHHCLFSILQEHSTPERDLMAQGFLARTREQELPGTTSRVRVPRRFTDVTKELLAAVPPGADDLARNRAIERRSKELVEQCEKRPATRCSVNAFDGGLWYALVDTLELQDLRLVYAPPRAVGEYGGEVDNWQWPRHSGDFAVARVYVAKDGTAATFNEQNVPWKPPFYFPISAEGVKPDDFVMVLGYPARTYRSLIAAEVAERVEKFFPARNTLYAQWLRLMEEATAGDPAAKIAIADDAKSLANRRKNAEGQLAGFARGRLLEKTKKHEAEVMAWAQGRKGLEDALQARAELEQLTLADRKTFDRDFLLDHLQPSPPVVTKALVLPTTLVRAARERTRPDLDRDPTYMDRNLPRVKELLEREQKRLHEGVDRAVTLAFLRAALALPQDQRIAAVDARFGKLGPTELPAAVQRLYAQSRVLDATERMKMFEETEAQLRARKDPLLDLGFALADEVDARVERKDRHEGAISRLRPAWRRAVIGHAGRPVDPDANATLRVSFAKVKGYAPADGIFYTPQTTLSGMLAKHTGQEPFDVPERILHAAADGRYGRWLARGLNDVPVNFLSDADTTGGNSGSPTVNARGQLVGVNFDRVWENVANDFGYNADIARNVNADIRYMLWLLDEVEDAGELLLELGIPRSPKKR
jgi:hypothetical protein